MTKREIADRLGWIIDQRGLELPPGVLTELGHIRRHAIWDAAVERRAAGRSSAPCAPPFPHGFPFVPHEGPLPEGATAFPTH
jgi:hypothetical protein